MRWKVHEGKEIRLLGQSKNDFYAYYGQAFDVSSDGAYIFGASKKKEKYVLVEDLQDGQSKTLKGHSDTVMAVQFSKRYKRLYTASYDKSVIAWDMRTMAELHRAKYLHNDQIYTMALSKKERHLFTGGRDKHIKILLASTMQVLTTLNFSGQIYCVRLSKSNAKLMVSGWNNSCFEIWETEFLCFEDISVASKRKQERLLADDFMNDQTMCSDSMIQQFVIRGSNFSQNLLGKVGSEVDTVGQTFLSGSSFKKQNEKVKVNGSNSLRTLAKLDDEFPPFERVEELEGRGLFDTSHQNVGSFLSVESRGVYVKLGII